MIIPRHKSTVQIYYSIVNVYIHVIINTAVYIICELDINNNKLIERF